MQKYFCKRPASICLLARRRQEPLRYPGMLVQSLQPETHQFTDPGESSSCPAINCPYSFLNRHRWCCCCLPVGDDGDGAGRIRPGFAARCVKVPAGVAMETVGVGEITLRVPRLDAAGREWVFVGPGCGTE